MGRESNAGDPAARDRRAAARSYPKCRGGRTPTPKDWDRLARGWRPMLKARIRSLEDIRDRLSSFMGARATRRLLLAAALLEHGKNDGVTLA